MTTLQNKNEVLSIENNNEYVLTIKTGSGFAKSKTEYFISYYDDMTITIIKEDNRNNISKKTYFRKSRKSTFNLIEKN